MSPSRKVLVVEDEPLVADFISRGMQDNGYLVDIASDGEWALSRIRTDGYDLIILDLRLPGRGGLEICRELREKHCSIPILMLTALDGSNDIVHGLNSGADDYLPKPFDFDVLLARVRALLRRNTKIRGNLLQVADLALNTLARHPGVATLAMHVTPPKSSENVIIASNFGQIGRKADPEDLQVIETGRPIAEVSRNGKRFRADMPLRDVGGKTIGALSLTFPFTSGADTAKLQQQATLIRDEVSRRITYVANLFEPAQFDASVPTNTYAQKLVDETLARHPEVLILALHVTPPNRTDNVIMASNIGRIGKRADE